MRDAKPRTAPMARRRDGDIAPYRQAARAVRTETGRTTTGPHHGGIAENGRVSYDTGVMTTSQSNSNLPQRKPLGHSGTPPEVWYDGTPMFFVTVCADPRDGAPLLPAARAILDSVQHLNESGEWYAKFVVVMPDHVHFLVTVPSRTGLGTAIGSWKRYLARTCDVQWQANFFDHRIRNAKEEAETFEYIRQNPMRRGLCAHPEDWPWFGRWGGPTANRGAV